MDPTLADVDRSGNFDLKILSNNLYDFQDEAANHAVERLYQHSNVFGLFLDRGCGKTITTGQIIKKMEAKKILALTPCGLEKQFASELNYCFRDLGHIRTRVIVEAINLVDALSSKDVTEVFVMCRRVWTQCSGHFFDPDSDLTKIDLVILDEAHSFSGKYLYSLSSRFPKLLLLSGKPTPSLGEIMKKMGASPEDMFVFRKSSRILKKLKIRDVNLIQSKVESSTEVAEKYWGYLHEDRYPTPAKMLTWWFPKTCLAILEWYYFRPCPLRLLACLRLDIESSQSLVVLGRIKYRPQGLRRFAQRCLGSRLKAIEDFEIPSEFQDFIEDSIKLEATHKDEDICERSGLYGRELQILRQAHAYICHTLDSPIHLNDFINDASAHQRLLVYASSRSLIDRMSRALDPKKHWIRTLLTRTSQKTRHNVIETFCGKDDVDAQIQILIRGLQKSSRPCFRRVGNLHETVFSNIVSSFLIPVKFLFMDSDFDISVNLQQHTTSIILASVPASASQLANICNRITRICFGDALRPLPIHILVRTFSLDNLFLHNLDQPPPVYRMHTPTFAGLDRETFEEVSEEMLRLLPESARLSVTFAKKLITSRKPSEKFSLRSL